jgi:hypothetical protein
VDAFATAELNGTAGLATRYLAAVDAAQTT